MAIAAITIASSHSLRLSIRTTTLPLIRCCSTNFNISFAPDPKPPTLAPKTLSPDPSSPSPPILIPWIVRGEDGKLTLQSSPPKAYLQALADAKTAPKNAKKTAGGAKNRVDNSGGGQSQYSKAARRFYNEKIKEDSPRLSKVLAAAGVASRRASEELIFGGKVTVNGVVCTSPQTRVDLSKDSVYVNGNRLSKKLPPKLYFVLNKPKGYICSSGKEPKSIISLFDNFMNNWNKMQPGLPKPRLFTVGRLDVATTGLIFVTNDGDFAQRLSHPSSALPKEYIATIDGTIHKKHLIAISEGTQVDGVHCVPDSVELLPMQPDATKPRLRVVVHDGRNHEVRELVKSAGLELYSLKRVRIGKYKLPSDLGIGKYAELKQSDFKLLEGNNQNT